MRRLMVLGAVVALLAAACGGSGDLEVSDAWARNSARMQDAGAVYLTINGGGEADRLLSASVPAAVAARAELHESSMADDGQMMMQMLPAIEVPADGEVALAPGGLHVMLMQLADPLDVGEEFDVTLTFEQAGTVTVTVEVREE